MGARLEFSPEEACQALDEMEMDGTRDGKVSLDEFVDWWHSVPIDTELKMKGKKHLKKLKKSA